MALLKYFYKSKVTFIAAIASALFVLLQYLDVRATSRIERSLELLFKYQDGSILEARNAIDLFDETPVVVVASRETKDSLNLLNEAVYENNIFSVKNKCKENIWHFAKQKIVEIEDKKFGWFDTTTNNFILRQSNKVVKEDILRLGNGEAIKTNFGIVTRSENKLWWFVGQTNYLYGWPSVVSQYFYLRDADACEKFVNALENKWGNETTEMIHTLKHFYNHVSICTVSGVCDALVSCNAFHGEIGTFVRNWAQYLEIWGPKENKSEYIRLRDFLSHCSENTEYMEFSASGRISNMLVFQQFTNWCWKVDLGRNGLCAWGGNMMNLLDW